jgi:hypothetical protein
MSSMKMQIKECLCVNLEKGLDAWILQSGFVRRKHTLIYTRELTEALQRIEITVEVHPADRPDSAAAVYPWLDVSMDAVDKLVIEMVGGDLSLLPGLPGGTLREPIEFTSAKAMHARWFVFQADSVPGVVSEIQSFIQMWTLPFLDSYSTPRGICDAYERGDTRVINDLAQKLRVAAAMVLCGRSADAVGVMEKWFAKPGPRKRYQRVFDYLTTKN